MRWPCSRATLPPSASPISARRPSSGIARPASRSPTPSSGRIAAPPPICDRLRADGHDRMIRDKTGLVIDAYFSGDQDRVDSRPRSRRARQRAEGGRTRLRHHRHLAHLEAHRRRTCTSPMRRNASRTMLFNIHTGAVGRRTAPLFRTSRATMLPEVRPSSAKFTANHDSRSSAACPIAGIAGDQQAALFGQACYRAGHGEEHVRHRLLHAACTGDESGRIAASAAHDAWRGGSVAARSYALEGSVFIGGAVVQWLRDGLGLIKLGRRGEALAATTPDSGGVYLVPAFAGLGAPHWDPYARGIDRRPHARHDGRAHRPRRARRRLLFRSADLLDAMQADAGKPVDELRVDGGASANDLLMQLQADLLGVPVVRPPSPRRRHSARRIWQAWPSASGNHRRRSQAIGGSTAPSSRQCRAIKPNPCADLAAHHRTGEELGELKAMATQTLKPLDGFSALACLLAVFVMVFPLEADILSVLVYEGRTAVAALIAVACFAIVFLPTALAWRRRWRRPGAWREWVLGSRKRRVGDQSYALLHRTRRTPDPTLK